MKIARVITSGFRGLPDRTFELTDPVTSRPFDLVLVTGAPACGKTSLLEAIAAAKEDVSPYGPRRSPTRYVRNGSAAAKIRVDWWLSEEERARVGTEKSEHWTESILSPSVPPSDAHDPRVLALLSGYDHARTTAKFEYFHEHRTLARGAIGSAAFSASEQRDLRLSKELFKYSAVPRFLTELYLDNRAAGFERIYAALSKNRKPGGLRKTYAGREIFFVADDGSEVGIEDLSASEQQAVIFAGTAEMVGLSRSIVLVDAPEKHIEGGAVLPFVAGLSELGTDNQLIVATGSRELVKETRAQAVIRLDRAS